MRKNIISVMAAVAFMPAVSFAAAPTLSDVLDASGISVTGHASGSFAYNHISGNGSGGGSASANQFTFDQAELTVSKLPTEGFGALVDVYAGQDVSGGTYNYTDIVSSLLTNLGGGGVVPQNILPTGSFNHFGPAAGAGTSEINLHQAYVQYASGGLTVIGGKFATLAGYEVASDALNTNATRSINFAAQAFTLTGVRAGYKFNDMVTAYAGLSNAVVAPALPFLVPGGIPLVNTVDYNPQKTIEVGVALAPVKGLTVNVTDYRGTEGIRTFGGGGIDLKVNLLDAVVAYTLGDLSLAYNFDYNTAKNTDGSSNAKFLGHALYANYQITPKIRAGVRGELTSTWDSEVASSKTKRNAVTLTGDYSASKNFDLVSDVRYAGVQTDPGLGGFGAHQITYVMKAVYKF